MSSTYRVVKLLKNHLYPTYQLHAYMANDKTTPQDGLRLAALTTMHWLKTRLGDDVPGEWRSLPSPEEYLSATDGRSISEQVAIGRSFSRQIAAAAGTGYYRFTTIQRTENPICAIRAFRSIEW